MNRDERLKAVFLSLVSPLRDTVLEAMVRNGDSYVELVSRDGGEILVGLRREIGHDAWKLKHIDPEDIYTYLSKQRPDLALPLYRYWEATPNSAREWLKREAENLRKALRG